MSEEHIFASSGHPSTQMLGSNLLPFVKNGGVFSPFSIMSSLNLLYEGTGSFSAKELESKFGFSKESLSEFEELMIEALRYLKCANAIFIADNVDPLESYLKNIRPAKVFAELNSEGNNHIQSVNEWVSFHTEDKISNLIKYSPSDRGLILINALNFKAIWKNQFKIDNTIVKDFTDYEGNVRKVSMMIQSGIFGYTEDAKNQVLKMDYQTMDLDFNFVVILPKKSKSPNITIDYESLQKYLVNFKNRDVKVELPKFKERTRTENFKEIFKNLGVTSIFEKLDLSKMIRTVWKESEYPFYVDQITHEVVFEVNEYGTAASTIEMSFGASPPPPPPPSDPIPFIANRPFIYLVMFKKSVIFMGKFRNNNTS